MLRGRVGSNNLPPVLYSEESGGKFLKRSVRALRVSCKCAGRGLVLFIPPIFVLITAYLRGRLWAFRTIVSLTILPLISTAAFLVEIMRARKTMRSRANSRGGGSSFQSILLFSMAAHAFAWWCIASVFSPASSLEKFYIQRPVQDDQIIPIVKNGGPAAMPAGIPPALPAGMPAGMAAAMPFGHLSWAESQPQIWTEKLLESTPIEKLVQAHLNHMNSGVISIVLAAYNEHQYANKTLESILKATPPGILREIIIVDDGSDPPMNTSYPVDQFPDPLVKVRRNNIREGLIRSKVFGGAAAVGEVLVFLDAHVKPDPSWWLPILKHIKENPKRVVVPLIPVLNGDTWEVNRNAVGSKMMFEWDLSFHWFNDDNDWVPCMSGGLLAIHKDWWHLSGELDTGMYVWGGENIEQSIRIWLCGGEIVVARDSVIAHVFRPSFPYPVDGAAVQGNKQRTVEVWFDEYKEFFYESNSRSPRPPFKIPTITEGGLADIPEGYDGPLKGVNERLKIREQLQCKPFKTYVDRFEKVLRLRNMLPITARRLQKSNGQCLTVDALPISQEEHRYKLTLEPCDETNYRQWMALDGIDKDGAGNKTTIRSLVMKEACIDAGIGRILPHEWRVAMLTNLKGETIENPNVPLEQSALETYLCTEPNLNQAAWEIKDNKIYYAGTCLIYTNSILTLSHECHGSEAEWFLSAPRLFSPNELRHFS